MKMGRKARRDLTNGRPPALADADYCGPRTIIESRFKLVIHEPVSAEPRREPFDLEAEPTDTMKH